MPSWSRIFSVELVYANSHSDKPMIYKISGVWGNHEGSMLLWLLIVVLFGRRGQLVRGEPSGQPAGPGDRGCRG